MLPGTKPWKWSFSCAFTLVVNDPVANVAARTAAGTDATATRLKHTNGAKTCMGKMLLVGFGTRDRGFRDERKGPAEPEITLSAPREFPVTTCFDLSRSENFVQSPAGPGERIN